MALADYESPSLMIQQAAKLLRDAIHYDNMNGFSNPAWDMEREEFIKDAYELEEDDALFDRDERVREMADARA